MSIFDGMAEAFADAFDRGEIIIVQPEGGEARDVTGRAIFRRKGRVVATGDADFVTSGPELHLAEADAADVDEGAAVTVDGEAFVVTTALPDGRAMVRLALHFAGGEA